MNDTEALEKPIINHPGKVINSYRKEEVVKDLIRDEETTYQLADKYGVSQPRISQIKSENREIIEQKKAELIKLLPSVVDTARTDVNTNKRLSNYIALDFKAVDKDLVALKTSLDKTNLNILKLASEDGVGIFPTNTIRFGDDNSQHLTVVSPAFQQFLDFQSNNQDNSQVIDTQGDNVDDDK